MNRFLALLAAPLALLPTDALANPYRLLNDSELVATIRATGTTVKVDAPDCYKRPVLGYYRTVRDSRGNYIVDEMTICVTNHGMDYQELGDTLRHEAVHVAQECHGGPILSVSTLLEYASPETLRMVRQYPSDVQHVELEAWTLAAQSTNDQISEFVKVACSG